MGWIRKKTAGIREGLEGMSLKKVVGCYIIGAVVGTLLAFFVSYSILNGWKRLIDNRNADRYGTGIIRVYNTEGGYFELKQEVKGDAFSVFLGWLQYWLLPLLATGGMMSASVLFYNRRLREPLELLKKEAEHIGRGDLEFECVYHRKDELGRLCRTFDRMRRQLGEDYRRTQKLMEQQRRLNAAFAHDLRTPLTVLRGYTDYLSRYCPEGKVSQEELICDLKIMDQQVLRLMNFCSTMKELRSLEDLEVKRKEILLPDLDQQIRDVVDIMDGTKGICFSYSRELKGDAVCSLDMQIFMEVLENLLSNASRYARSRIEVILSGSEDGRYLLLHVRDDGPGFTNEGLKMAAAPYYRDKKESEGNHFGIGLFLCSLFCQKHGGELELSNSISGGALITAAFLGQGETL